MQAAAFLQNEISSGKITRFVPGELELCEKLHISRVTLRAALKILERSGVVRSQQGRRREVVGSRRPPAWSASRQVVLLSPSPLQALSFNALFWIDALREYLAEENYHLDLRVSRAAFGPQAEHVLANLAEQSRPAGWVLYKSTEPMQRWFSERRLPAIITGSRHAGVKLPSVDIAYRAVCRHAVGLFIARGHRQIALVNPASGLSGDVDSELGFQDAVSRSGQAEVQGQVIRHDGTPDSICRKLDAAMGRPQSPTAFLVSRPEHVLTVACHLLRRACRPPDVVLISRDDALFLENMVPSIARYAFNPQIFAGRISKTVLGMVQGSQTKPADHQIMPRFVFGQTLG